jgi:hypothetical protein
MADALHELEPSPPMAPPRHFPPEHMTTMWMGLVKKMHATQAICLLMNAIFPLLLPLYLFLDPQATKSTFAMDQTQVPSCRHCVI